MAENEAEDDADTIAPFTSEWPGLAPAGERLADPDVTAAAGRGRADEGRRCPAPGPG